MKLYNLPGACPMVTQIVLEWMGLEYELENVAREALKQPAFLALNPAGSVPVFTDGDLVLTQSVAILEYLTDLHPEAGLHGKTPAERAQVRRWLSFCNADLHRTFAMLFGVAAYSEDPAIQQVLVSKSAEKLVFLFGLLDQQLQGRDYLSGTRSIADPYLYVLLRWAQVKQINVSEMANLQRFFKQMDSDEGVRRALTKQGMA
ncbi:glutathione S-transferase family protein [Pusillimonas sp. CC-YST705]|uniref:Glutathione S-transferase family protein n=1 Tax=Mesopusillimonas faecipullorum TaxID=2755040 RepID=A0ABS8CAK9_9BURK|nr:glutathione S-transferase family protein [Mesopusillimonas faecipullorum]MCB5363070.1 glutathione S-transferase family protein [Mesopusillimonas faecipullorum]